MCSSSSSLICWVPYSPGLNAYRVLTNPLPGECPSSWLEKAIFLWSSVLITCQELVDIYFLGVRLILIQSSRGFLETQVCWPWPCPWAAFWKWLSLTVVVFKMHVADNSGKKKTAGWVILCLGEHPSRNMIIFNSVFSVSRYIDQGRNPQLYTKECLERALAKNEQVKGKIDTMKVSQN